MTAHNILSLKEEEKKKIVMKHLWWFNPAAAEHYTALCSLPTSRWSGEENRGGNKKKSLFEIKKK